MKLVGVVLSVFFTIVANAQLNNLKDQNLAQGMNNDQNLSPKENVWSGSIEEDSEVIDMSTMYEISVQIFESLAKADQTKFSEFTTNNGFKYVNNQQEEVLITISQLFEKNGYSSWLRFVRERASMFTCTDSSTPFDYCTPNNEKPKLMIKTYPEDSSLVDIYVWDTRNNPYRMVIGCSVEGKWLFIKNINVEICAN